MKQFIVNSLWWLTLCLAIFLLIAHTFLFENINVDNISVTLLVVIFLSPFISSIRKIKFGDFEAEIDPKEVRKIKEGVEAQLADMPTKQEEVFISNLSNQIIELANNDIVLALAKLRIEIERIIFRLHSALNIQVKVKGRYSLTKMISDLTQRELVPSEVYGSLRQVISICNRAVHGEEIRSQDAKMIIEAGVDLLKILYSVYPDIIAAHVIEEIPIRNDELENLRNSKYKVNK